MRKFKLQTPAGALAVLFLIMQQAAFLLVLSLPAQANTSMNTSLTIKLVSLPSPVTGLITVQAKVNQGPDSVQFQIVGPNNIYQTFIGQKLNETTYYFDWNTKEFANGAYRLTVHAIKDAYLAYDEMTVDIVNSIEDNDENINSSTSTSAINNDSNEIKSEQLEVDSMEATTSSTTESNTLPSSQTEINTNPSTETDLTQKIDENNEPSEATSSLMDAQETGGEDLSQDKEEDMSRSTSLSIEENDFSVQIISPTNSAQISQDFVLIAKTTSSTQAVDFYFQTGTSSDYVLLGKGQPDKGNQEWKLTWPTANLANGVYILQARAKNQAGQTVYSQPIAVEVLNAEKKQTNNKKEIKEKSKNQKDISLKTTATSSAKQKQSSLQKTQQATSSLIQKKSEADKKTSESQKQTLKDIDKEIKAIQTTLQADLSTSTVGQEVKVKTRVEVRDRFLGEKIITQECKDKQIEDKNECWQFLKEKYGVFSVCQNLSASECSSILRSDLILSVQQMTALERLPGECLAANINFLPECEVFLRSQYAAQACLDIGLTSKEDCLVWLEKKFGPPVECLNLSKKECQKLNDEIILADFISPRFKAEVKKELKSVINKHIIIAQQDLGNVKSAEIIIDNKKQSLAAGQDFSRTVSQVLPLTPTDKEVKVTILPSANKNQELSVGAVLIFDQDGDGLSDEIEARLGTDPTEKDTDGDGYDDKEEIAAGYNPVGAGKLSQQLAPIEKAIASGQTLAEPKQEGRLTPALKVLAVKNQFAESQADHNPQTATSSLLHFEGQALPNQIVSLYIYSSLPIVITVKTDSNGNWVYDLDQTLADGKHEVYVAINNQDGSIAARSAPFAFFIKGAKAASADEFVQVEETASISTAQTPAKKMIKSYVWAAIAMVAGGLIVFLLYYHYHQQHNKQATV